MLLLASRHSLGEGLSFALQAQPSANPAHQELHFHRSQTHPYLVAASFRAGGVFSPAISQATLPANE